MPLDLLWEVAMAAHRFISYNLLMGIGKSEVGDLYLKTQGGVLDRIRIWDNRVWAFTSSKASLGRLCWDLAFLDP